MTLFPNRKPWDSMTNGQRLTVLYDACVLYPNYLRDVLIQLATTGLFQAKWTEQIHDEWIRNILKNRPDITITQLQSLKHKINQSVPDCLVTDFAGLIPTLNLPDPDDRHVLAAAIVVQANVIVTLNLKDFPAATLLTYGVVAQHPDDFITDLIDLDPLCVLRAVQAIQSRLKKPSVNFDEYMEILQKQGLSTSVAILHQIRDGNFDR
jgi:predicted nucleic acid-binding protein